MKHAVRIRTDNYFQKLVARRLVGQRGYSDLRLYKTILFYKLGVAYELPRRVLLKLVTPGDVVLDIGANLGQYACRLSALVGAEGTVLCFEPVGENFRLLNKMVKILGLQNVRTFRSAISDYEGQTEIFIPVITGDIEVATQASLQRRVLEGANARVKTERVDVVPVDAVLSELDISKLDVMKCDSEGHDVRVVIGARASIERHKPILLLEVAPDTEGLSEIYAIGYKAFYHKRGRLHEWTKANGEGVADCYIYIHKESSRLRDLL